MSYSQQSSAPVSRSNFSVQWGIGFLRFGAQWMDGWMKQAYSRLSTTHGHITDCKLVCMYWTRPVLVRPAASLYSASPPKHRPTGKQ